ncbi:MAG: 50S ribosomal protein L37ae [Promethearchaeota archaeon]
MGRTKKVGIAGRFGPRYGTLVRYRIKKIEDYRVSKYKCPKCQTKAVRRYSVGIWLCKKCGAKFTGGAYTQTTQLGIVSARTAKRKQKEKQA